MPSSSRTHFGALALLAALLLAACTGTSEGSPTPEAPATSEVTATAAPTTPPPLVPETPPPTASPIPTPQAELWLINVVTGEQQVVYEAINGSAIAWWEPGGRSITAAVSAGNADRSAYRYILGQGVAEEFPNRLLITPSPDGRSRYWFERETVNGREQHRLILEHNGIEVPIDVGIDFTWPAGFSPSGDRLLVGRGNGSDSGASVAWTYWVIDVASGVALLEFEGNRSPEGTDDGYPARWSPSGRWIATAGLDGLLTHDTTDGTTVRLGARGSTEWSPVEDALVTETDDGQIDVVRLPSFERIHLETEGGQLLGRFDRSGDAVVVRSYGDPDRFRDPLMTIFHSRTAEELARWPGYADEVAYPVVATPAGLAAWINAPPESLGCSGFLLFHPQLPDGGIGAGRCVEGTDPRWSPDATQLAFARSTTIVVLDIATDTERVFNELGLRDERPLARWNDAGTHLLVQRHWGGVGWHDALE